MIIIINKEKQATLDFFVFFIDVSKTIVFYLVEFRCKKWENVYQKKHQKLKRKHKK